MKRSHVRALFYLYVLLAVFVGGTLTVYFVSERQTTVLPADSVYMPETDFAPDSSKMLPYYRRRYPRRTYPPRQRYTPPAYSSGGERTAPASFAFDPNTADSTALLALGLSPSQVRNVYKYRAKGGQYHVKEDFHRLYGMTNGQWRHLEPLIHIGEEYQYVQSLPRDTVRLRRDTTRFPVKYTEIVTIPLNRCDTSALKHIPGVGTGYARMIVSYRERLGGYVSVAQLSDIEDLPADLVRELAKWLTVEPSLVHKINLNKLTLSQLKRHPYLTFTQAKAICDCRRLNGPLHSLADLKLYEEFSERDFARLAPYVAF